MRKYLNKKILSIVLIIIVLLIGLITSYYLFKPKIELIGNDTIEIALNKKYKELGYKVKILNKDISKKIKIKSNLNTKKIGNYKITYTIKYGIYKITKIRNVKVLDKEIPVITLVNGDAVVCPNKEYQEEGYSATDNYDGDITNKVEVIKEKYLITYKVLDTSNNKFTIKRNITYKDEEKPVITLNKANITIFKGNNFVDPGYSATDNCGGDLTDKVSVSGTVNTNIVGTYTIKYSVKDESENIFEITRKVYVKEKLVATPKIIDKGDKTSTIDTSTINDNTITLNKWINNGIYIEGYVKDIQEVFNINLKNNGETIKTYSMEKISGNTYKGNIDLSGINNGTYNLFINDKQLLNSIDLKNKLMRAHINDKLVTFDYFNNNVSIKIEDFVYQYDILIDPGHGGSDPGAVNNSMMEKDLNLTQSIYEKERYEAHGLRVKLIRTDDSYGIGMGDSSWTRITRRAYAIGYYGSVSKISYSNHHNSSGTSTTKMSGYELIVSNKLSSDSLSTERTIASLWNGFYNLTESHIRFYTRNYDSGTIYSKSNGEVYNFMDWYAVNRIPYDLFNVKNVLFEGCYMNNSNDFNWYYEQSNYKKASEIKIKAYVESLGVTYIPN